MRALIIILATLAGVSAATVAPAQTPARLTGIVRDSAGGVLADAEVILRETSRGIRTNARGEFTLDDVAPGAYRVWFRRLGYRSVEYNWAARGGEHTELSVALAPVPRQLDPVVVRADEDKRAAAHASILGLVIDANEQPIPEAEVQLRRRGHGRHHPLERRLSSSSHSASAPTSFGVRKLGYSPVTVTVQLVPNDDREVVVRLDPLATKLDPTIVTEKSGYGKDQIAWDELEKRKRWQSFQTRFLGPEDLKSFYGVDLAVATIRMGLNNPRPNGRARPMSINPNGTRRVAQAADDGFACILLNGKEGVYHRLSLYSTADIELLEVYPPTTPS